MINQDFLAAESRHGDKFRSAWSDWYEAVKDGKDAQTYFTVMNSASPGEAMVQWYKRATRDRELGDDDLDAFKQRVIDEYLGHVGRGAAAAKKPQRSIPASAASAADSDVNLPHGLLGQPVRGR